MQLLRLTDICLVPVWLAVALAAPVLAQSPTAGATERRIVDARWNEVLRPIEHQSTQAAKNAGRRAGSLQLRGRILSGGIDVVTGGAGFIGSHLVDRLLSEPDRSVRVVDNFGGLPVWTPSAESGLNTFMPPGLPKLAVSSHISRFR